MASSLCSLDCFECSVCMESMLDKRPLVLSCLHTFCTSCVTRLYKGSPLVCPTCRSETVLPDDDVGKLPINRDLIKIMVQLRGSKMSTLKTEPLCDTCLRKGNHHQSVGMCVQCVRKLCQLCIDRHQHIAAFQSHQIVTSVVKSEEQEENVCVTHNEVMQYMCTICLAPLCIDCTNEDGHEEHLDKVQPLEKGVGELRAEHKKMTNKVDKYVKNLETLKKLVTSDIEVLDTSVKELNDLRDSFQRKIDEVDTLLRDVSLYGVPMRQLDKEIKQMIDHARRQQNILKSAEKCSDLKFLSQRKEKSANSDFVYQEDAIRQKANYCKIPKFCTNKYFADKSFAHILIGEIKELSPGKENKAETAQKIVYFIPKQSGKCFECNSRSPPITRCSFCQADVCDWCESDHRNSHS